MASDPKEAIEDLKQVYEDFAKPVGHSSTTFGCLMVLVIIAGIITCFYVSWLLGIIGSIALLVVMVLISNRVEAPHKKRAKERVSQLEQMYALPHQESFDLLLATRSGIKDGDKSEWRAFVTEVWGDAVLASAQKQEQISESTASAGHPVVKIESVFDESNQADPDKIAAIVLECARMCSHSKLYIQDKIPEDKEQNARGACEIPPGESLLALIDCTSFGSAKNCLVFTTSAIYGHNDWAGKTPGTVKIPYSEIHSRIFSDAVSYEIGLDHEQFLNVSGAGSKKEIISLLCRIKERLTGTSDAAGSSNCPRCQSASIETKSEFKSSTAAHFAGQALFGIVGNIIAGAAFGRTIENCECKSCGYKWVNEKPKG